MLALNSGFALNKMVTIVLRKLDIPAENLVFMIVGQNKVVSADKILHLATAALEDAGEVGIQLRERQYILLLDADAQRLLENQDLCWLCLEFNSFWRLGVVCF